MKYIIDSNCFITPSRTFCPTDVGVSFWNKIKSLAEEGRICSIDKVKDELYTNSDELQKWMSSNITNNFFIKFDGAEQAQKLSTILRWAATSTTYNDKAKHKFMKMDKADIYLAAFASVNPQEWKVVSMERSAPNSQAEIKLPDVCSRFGVSCIQPEEMFREMKETF